MMALTKTNDEQDDYTPKSPIAKDGAGTPNSRRGLTHVRSGSNLAALVVEQKQGVDLKQKEE